MGSGMSTQIYIFPNPLGGLVVLFNQRRAIPLPNELKSVHPVMVSIIEYAVGALVRDYNGVVGHSVGYAPQPTGLRPREKAILSIRPAPLWYKEGKPGLTCPNDCLNHKLFVGIPTGESIDHCVTDSSPISPRINDEVSLIIISYGVPDASLVLELLSQIRQRTLPNWLRNPILALLLLLSDENKVCNLQMSLSNRFSVFLLSRRFVKLTPSEEHLYLYG